MVNKSIARFDYEEEASTLASVVKETPASPSVVIRDLYINFR